MPGIREGDREKVFRRWLAQKLRERARGRYTVPEEVEIDQDQRPDIRLENPNTGPVSIEVKWAQNWTFTQLFEGLEIQLVSQYLRAHNSRYGVYVLGMIGQHQWVHPQDRYKMSFEEIVALLQARSDELARTCQEVSELRVISIDFRPPRPRGR